MYLSTPHPAGDPVMAAKKDRVLEFLRGPPSLTTRALECQHAAICLTLRGVSIVRAFRMVGPGRRRPEPQHLPHREFVRWQSRFHGHERVPYRGRAPKAGRHFHGQGKHLGSHTFTTPDMKTLDVLFFFRSNRAHRVFLRSSSKARRRPSTDKRLREDLYKKVMIGDPVAARLPNAILTKMVTFSGWKRFEMNETLKFHGLRK